MTYQPGDHVFTSHQGDIYKCLVLAVDGDNYTIAPIDNEPGAWQGERHVSRIRPRRYERFTVADHARLLARGIWSYVQSDGGWYKRIQKERRRLNDVAIGIECEHCGASANQGDHAAIIDSMTGETTHACGYPQELNF